MSPDQYCRERAARRGASLHYSLLFTEETMRRRLLALHALRHELCAVEQDCSDAQVARLKLQWWRDELRRAAAGTSQHPVTQALYAKRAGPVPPLHELLTLIDNLETALSVDSFPTVADLLKHCHGIGGLTGRLAVELRGFQDSSTPQLGEQCGAALQYLDRVFKARVEAAQGRLSLPRDELARYSMSLSDLCDTNSNAKVRALLQDQLDSVRQMLLEVATELPAPDHWAQHHLLIIARLHLLMLNTLSVDVTRVFRQQVTLPGWRKLLIAWRTARKTSRLAM